MTPHIINNDIWYKDTIVATISETDESIEITPLPGCTIGQYLSALSLLQEKGKKIIEPKKW